MFAADDRLARRRPRLSRSLHRAVRHAVVHLSAADLLRRREAHPPRAVAGDLAGRRGARDRAHRHRLDGDRRIRRTASSISTPAISFAPHVFALAAGVQRKPVHGARRPLRSGRVVNAAHGASPAMPTGRSSRSALALLGAGAVVVGLGADGAERRVPAAALLRPATRSSSISRSSCRWRRPAPCCSRPASSPISAPSRCWSRPAGVDRRAGAGTGRCADAFRFLFERPAWAAPASPRRIAGAMQPAE